ncbi:MAG TPA: membrane protein insertase YidC [Nitrospira sp.]|nr:membrane protein insertase YidC [Nitrospira sp.]
MEKRVVIFLVLSIAVILGYDLLLKQLDLLPQPEPTQTQRPFDGAGGEPTPTSLKRIDSSPSTVDAKEPETGPGEARPAVDETVTIETDLLRVTMAARGGVITGWDLKKYRKTSADPEPVQLVYQGGKFRAPLSVKFGDPGVEKAVHEGLFSINADFDSLNANRPVGHVTMRFEDPASGITVYKQLTFRHDSYLVDVDVTVEGVPGPYEVVLGTNFGIVEWGEGFIGLIGSASLVDGKIEKETPDDELVRKGDVRWVALQDKYFIGVLLPERATAALVKKEGDKLVSAGVKVGEGGKRSTSHLRLYAGPKEYDTLRSLNVGLEDTIDFGWFIFGSWSVVKAVAKPIFYVLRFINEYTHNYGVTIILLTLAIKLIFVPLQYKSYKSMKQMQVIQPKVAALQEKLKDDRDRLNKELIKLYRDHKVNPVGGCLPMVLQMPVFVALFNILYMTIDLRQAPFFGWITDLSVQDPYYVLPIIMGATMVIQQKITPTTMDPTQAKIMLMLPVFMTFLFINFPAGLVLYWLTNNVLTILQQVFTDRVLFANKMLVPETVK